MSVLLVPRPVPVRAVLDDLRAGQRGVIAEVVEQGAVGERLLEMGMTPGVVVEVVRRAPFGGPMVVRLRGYLLALRRAQARAVRIRRLAGLEAPAHAGAA